MHISVIVWCVHNSDHIVYVFVFLVVCFKALRVLDVNVEVLEVRSASTKSIHI